MRVLRTSILVALLQPIAVTMSSALPFTDSTIASRSTFCHNAPKTIAGSMLNVRSLLMASDGSVSETAILRRTASMQSAHVRRVNGDNAMVWCAGNSRTYIVIKLASMLAGESIPSTINIARGIISTYIRVVGDGPVTNGRYEMVGLGGVQVMARNADNHQLTWGVLSAALAAVLDYMRVFGNGAATFNIFDGTHMVGQGTVQVSR